MDVAHKQKIAYKVYSVEDETKIEQAFKWRKEEQNETIRDAARKFSLDVNKIKCKWLELNQ